MFLLIDNFLTKDELQALRAMVARANFVDGSATADDLPENYKSNLQYVPRGEDLRRVGQFVWNGISRSRAVQDGALIRRMMPPMISKYTPGMEYKSHLDSPYMDYQGPLRIDLSMTLFRPTPSPMTAGSWCSKRTSGTTGSSSRPAVR